VLRAAGADDEHSMIPMPFAMAVDIVLWTLAGLLVGLALRRLLPHRQIDVRLVMLGFFVLGTFVTMITFPQWAIYPR
jgi:uncharacterized membrane protein YedE/YeeE